MQGADRFVDGASDIAIHLRWSPILVGAVVIGFGTSAPELLVSAIASAQGDLDLGVGNVIGSNVANLTLVLGVAAMVAVLFVDRPVLLREAPLATGAVAVFTASSTWRWNSRTGSSPRAAASSRITSERECTV